MVSGAGHVNLLEWEAEVLLAAMFRPLLFTHMIDAIMWPGFTLRPDDFADSRRQRLFQLNRLIREHGARFVPVWGRGIMLRTDTRV